MPHPYDTINPEPERTDYDAHGAAPDPAAGVMKDYTPTNAEMGFTERVLFARERMAHVIALLRRRYPAIAEEVERDA